MSMIKVMHPMNISEIVTVTADIYIANTNEGQYVLLICIFTFLLTYSKILGQGHTYFDFG